MMRVGFLASGLVGPLVLALALPAAAQLTNPSRPANPLPPVGSATPAPDTKPAPAAKPATQATPQSTPQAAPQAKPAPAPAATTTGGKEKEQPPLPTLSMVVPQRDRDAAFAYYRDEIAAGRCPAPLVREGKACGAPPPPASRAWKMDQPLPDSVKGEAPPPGLIAKLSPSYAGHQYLRVGTDILIIGVGTRTVAALVVDLSRLTP
ncbi:MAG: hypothetical protein LCH95_08855 [Proteobacteria bacterium]|nr:hypothetical protein [Pseudomonadota bacterium]